MRGKWTALAALLIPSTLDQQPVGALATNIASPIFLQVVTPKSVLKSCIDIVRALRYISNAILEKDKSASYMSIIAILL